MLARWFPLQKDYLGVISLMMIVRVMWMSAEGEIRNPERLPERTALLCIFDSWEAEGVVWTDRLSKVFLLLHKYSQIFHDKYFMNKWSNVHGYFTQAFPRFFKKEGFPWTSGHILLLTDMLQCLRAISYNCSMSSEKKTFNFIMGERMQSLKPPFNLHCFSGSYLWPFCFNNFSMFPFLFPSIFSCIVSCLEARFKPSVLLLLLFFPHWGICQTEVRVAGIFCKTSNLPKNRLWIKLAFSSFCHYLVGVSFKQLFVMRFLYL